MSYLVDTNIISEIRKRQRGDVNVQAWFSIVNPADIYLSVLVVGEIRQGIERLQGRDPTQAAVYDNWLETLRQDYVDRILPITEEVAQEWERINFPNPVPVVDGLMAATAKVKGMTLVTRNTADVASTGVSLLNPFNPSN